MMKSAQWYKGLPLQERLTFLERISAIDTDLADRQRLSWRSQKPLTNSAYYNAKLSEEKLTETKFISILGESDRSLAERCPQPNWLKKLIKSFAIEEISNVKIAPVENLTDDLLNLGFLNLVKPLLSQAIADLKIGIEKLGDRTPFTKEKIKGILLAKVPEQLLGILSQTMVLELNVARLEGKLLGETARERLIDFLHKLEKKQYSLEILKEYPVLARQVVIYLEQWVEVSLEFLERLCQDWELICDRFSCDFPPGVLLKAIGNRQQATVKALDGDFIQPRPRQSPQGGGASDPLVGRENRQQFPHLTKNLYCCPFPVPCSLDRRSVNKERIKCK